MRELLLDLDSLSASNSINSSWTGASVFNSSGSSVMINSGIAVKFSVD